MARPRGDRSDVPFGAPAGSFGPGRPATEAARGRAAKGHYRRGRSGKPFASDMSDPLPYDEQRELYEQGRGDRLERQPPPPTNPPPPPPAGPGPVPATPAVAPTTPTPRSSPSIRGYSIDDGAGFLLGVLAYALVMNYLQGGISQARGWVAAKFLNRPWAGAHATPATPATPARPDRPTTTVPAPPANAIMLVRGVG